MNAIEFLYFFPLLKLLGQVAFCIAFLVNPDLANPTNPSKFATFSAPIVALLATIPVFHVLLGLFEIVELKYYLFISYFCFSLVVDVFWYTDLQILGLIFIVVLVIDAIGLIIFGLQALWTWLRSRTPPPPVQKDRYLEEGSVPAVARRSGIHPSAQINPNQRSQRDDGGNVALGNPDEWAQLQQGKKTVIQRLSEGLPQNKRSDIHATGQSTVPPLHPRLARAPNIPVSSVRGAPKAASPIPMNRQSQAPRNSLEGWQPGFRNLDPSENYHNDDPATMREFQVGRNVTSITHPQPRQVRSYYGGFSTISEEEANKIELDTPFM